MVLYVGSITVSQACRLNIGNYEHVDTFISMTAKIDELDNEVEEAHNLAVRVQTAMADTLVRAHMARGKRVTRAEVIRQHGLALAAE